MECCIHEKLVWLGRYQHYLESVLEGADEFHEVGDLMLRHATLAATNQDLKEQRNHSGEAAEQTRLVLQTCIPSSFAACLQLPNSHTLSQGHATLQ